MMQAIAPAALTALLASCVLAALLAGVVALIVRFGSLDGAARHSLWTIALYATAIMPFAGVGISTARAVVAPPVFDTAAPVAGPSIDVDSSAPIIMPGHSPRFNFADTRSWAGQPMQLPRPSRTAALVSMAIWAAGALVGLAGLLRGLVRVRGLKRRSLPLDGALADELPWLTENSNHEREIYLRLSYETETPIAVGFRRPMILIPLELATQNGLRAIEGLVLHEHAHLRRRDDWTNFIGRLIERVLWFNPAVWYIVRRIALEREIAADDAVVAATGQPEAYATSLWQLAREMRMPQHSAVAPGAFFSRRQISVRIESLLEGRTRNGRWHALAAGTVALTALAGTVAVGAALPPIRLAAVSTPVPQALTALPHSLSSAITNAGRAAAHIAAHPVAIHIRFPAAPDVAAHAVQGMQRAATSLASQGVRVADIPKVATVAEGAGVAKAAAVAHVAKVAAVADIANVVDSAQARDRTEAGRDQLASARSCNGCDLSGRDLHNRDFRGIQLEGANLSGADLRGARLDGARLTGVDLSGVQLAGASLRDATLTATPVDGVSFRFVDTRGLRIVGVSLANLDLRGTDARSILSACNGCDAENVNLRDADLRGVNLTGTNLESADLRGVDFRGAHVAGASFESAQLEHADLRNAAFTGSSFDSADLRGAQTAGATFNGSDFDLSRR